MNQDLQPQPRPIIYRSKKWESDHGAQPVEAPVLAKTTKVFHRTLPQPQKVFNAKEDGCPCMGIMPEYKKHLNEKYQRHLELLKATIDIDGVRLVPPVAAPKVTHYRTHAKLAVRRRPGTDGSDRFFVGLFKPLTHEVQEHYECRLHRESINRLMADLVPMLNASRLEPYEEASRYGDIRYIAVRASHHTNEVMLTFVVTREDIKQELQNIVLQLRKLEHVIVSAHINVNDAEGNAIFGAESKRLTGNDRLRERLCDLDFEIGVTSFFQVNPWQAENIYRRVEHFVGHNMRHDVAWDLYCGIGQMSLLLARAGFRTLGIEENPQAIRDAQKNAIRNELENLPQFIAGRVEELHDQFPTWALEPKFVLVNPSRRGLADSVRGYLANLLRQQKDTRLIYVSCEMQTLARDLKDIVQSGRTLRQLEAFDMFPYADKMEWLAVIS